MKKIFTALFIAGLAIPFVTKLSVNAEGGAPAQPLIVGAKGVSANQINIAWSNSTSTIQEAGYKVYRNGTYLATTPYITDSDIWHEPSLYQDVGLSPNTSYSYYVTSVAADGSESGPSITVSARTMDASQNGLIPPYRRTEWIKGVTVGVQGGIPERTNIVDVSQAPYYVSASEQTTTGSISKDSNTLTVSDIKDFSVGQTISVKNASTHIYDNNVLVPLSSVITNISGNTVTLADQAKASANNTLVSHDDAGAIGRAINEAPDGSVVYLPPGVYGYLYFTRNNITVRGAGMNSTIVKGLYIRGGGGDGLYNRPSINVTSSVVKGTNQVTVSSIADFYVGQIIQFYGDNDYTVPEIGVTGFNGVKRQTALVTAISGNSVTFTPPITTGRFINPKVIPSISNTHHVGVENMTIDVMNLSQNALSASSIVNSWFRNLKIRGATNYTLNMGEAVFVEISGCYLDEQASTGTNHAGLLLGASTGVLFENNIVVRSFPLLEINGANTSSVFAYNYMIGNVVDTNHGPHNHNNLFEGNIMDSVTSDGYFGGESEETFLRNFIGSMTDGGGIVALKRWSRNFNFIANQFGAPGKTGALWSFGQPNIGNGSSDGFAAPSTGFMWRDLDLNTGARISATITSRPDANHAVLTFYDQSEFDRLMGYCAGLGSCMAIGLQVGDMYSVIGASETSHGPNTLSVQSTASLPSVGTVVKIWPRSEGFQERDLDVLTTAMMKGNKYPALGNAYLNEVDEDLHGETVPDSMYLTSKPGWFGDLAWPPIGNTIVSSADVIPAGYRYNHAGQDPPGVSGGTNNGPDTTSPIIGTPSIASSVSGTVTISVSAVDNVGVSGVQFKLNGNNLGTEDTSYPYQVSWNTTTVTDGPYTITAVARDAAGNSATSQGAQTTVSNSVVTPTLAIVGTPSSSVTTNSATITWTTNIPASTQVQYGTSASYGNTTSLISTLSTSHSVTIPNLSAGTTYHFKVISVASTTVSSGDLTFTISQTMTTSTTTTNTGTNTGTNTSTSLSIYNARVESIGGTTAVITWVTDKGASSQVEYGLTNLYGMSSGYDPTLLVAHKVTLTNLLPNQKYNYRVRSINSQAQAVSDNFTFTTLPINSAVLTPIQAVTNNNAPTNSNSRFTRNLTVGSIGPDVKQLQQFLNARNFTVSASGVGSKGYESTYFGTKTRLALQRFQISQGITPSSGYFGPITMARVNSLLGNTQTTATTQTTTNAQTTTYIPPVTAYTPYVFTRNLDLGDRSEDVRRLQMFLNRKGYTIAAYGPGSPGQESTYFGIATQNALIKFQLKNNILPAQGYFGTNTRELVNKMR